MVDVATTSATTIAQALVYERVFSVFSTPETLRSDQEVVPSLKMKIANRVFFFFKCVSSSIVVDALRMRTSDSSVVELPRHHTRIRRCHRKIKCSSQRNLLPALKQQQQHRSCDREHQKQHRRQRMRRREKETVGSPR